MKILIAEDELVSRKLLNITLESLGHDVCAASNGEDAWEIFQTNPYNYQVVISDWLMPRMTGLQLCEKIRGLNLSHYTYFILLTANSRTENNYVEAIDSQIDDFIAKPIRENQIWSRLVVANRILKFMDKIQKLENLLPVCPQCKKIRDDNQYWEEVDTYFQQYSEEEYKRRLCTECCESKAEVRLN